MRRLDGPGVRENASVSNGSLQSEKTDESFCSVVVTDDK